MALTARQKFRNGMLALGLDPDDDQQVSSYIENSGVGQKKYELMKAEEETSSQMKGESNGNEARD